MCILGWVMDEPGATDPSANPRHCETAGPSSLEEGRRNSANASEPSRSGVVHEATCHAGTSPPPTVIASVAKQSRAAPSVVSGLSFGQQASPRRLRLLAMTDEKSPITVTGER